MGEISTLCTSEFLFSLLSLSSYISSDSVLSILLWIGPEFSGLLLFSSIIAVSAADSVTYSIFSMLSESEDISGLSDSNKSKPWLCVSAYSEVVSSPVKHR